MIIGLIGLTTQGIDLAFGVWLFHFNTIILGLVEVVALLLLIATGTIVAQFVTQIYRGIFYVSKNIILNIVDPEQADCKIFEECKK